MKPSEPGVDKNIFDHSDFDTIPFPALDLYRKLSYIPLLTSRGCPFSCSYCASPILNSTPMRKSPHRVMEEIRHWHETRGVSDVVLYDDAFLVDAQTHAVPILEQIIDSGLSLRFHTPNALHVREVSKETAELMFKAGFKTIRLGLESALFEEREKLDRKVNEKEFHNAVSKLLSAGFNGNQIGAYLLAGLPGQTLSEIKRSIQIVKEQGIQPIPAYYSPIPHTALWNLAVKSSRYPIDSDPVFTNNAVFPCRKEPFSWKEISEIKALCFR
jgi:radical SAM superfamily enzyme YgiQ (UPF0313 family)